MTTQRSSISTVRIAAVACSLVLTFSHLPRAAVTDDAVVASVSPEVPGPLSTTVDVNVLLIGFEQSAMPPGSLDPFAVHPFWFEQVLPFSYDPITASWLDYGQVKSAGYHVDFRYLFGFADAPLEQRFFNFLTEIGQPAPRTTWQTRYNDQVHNAVVVPDEILRIDGAAVEAWLLKEVGGIKEFKDSEYTLVFVNWWGRPGFQFHVYTAAGVDPDTGRNMADLDAATMAWGGTHGTLWFYDVSAGPDAETSNWNVDDTMVPGAYHNYDLFRLLYGPFPDFRLAPIWEMNNVPDSRNEFVRDEDLGFNLAVIARTTVLGRIAPSSLYDPVATAPLGPGRKRLRIIIVDGNPGYDATRFLSTDWLVRELEKLQPMYQWEVSVSTRPLDAEAASAFNVWAGYWDFLHWPPTGQDCLGGFGYYALQCYALAHPEFAEPVAAGDVVIPFLVFNIPDAVRASLPPFAPLGIGADNGTPDPGIGVLLNYPAVQDRRHGEVPGLGLSSIIAHEVGHLVGQAHPFNIWDPAFFGGFIGQLGTPWLFAGDQAHSSMGYYAEPSGFGAFEQQANVRNLAAGYYEGAVSLLDGTSSNARAAFMAQLSIAAELFGSGSYLSAARVARVTYEKLVAGVGGQHPKTESAAARASNRLAHCVVVETPGCNQSSARVKTPAIPSHSPETHEMLKRYGVRFNEK